MREIQLLLSQVQPTILLFLHRLRRLELVDAVAGTTHVMERIDPLIDGGGASISAHSPGSFTSRLVQLTERRSTPRQDVTLVQEWLVINSPVAQSALTIALPMPSATEAAIDAPTTPLPPRDVFCFLPLRSYGLRFLLHANFAVPSARESIDEASAWNQQLRAAVPHALVHASVACLEEAERRCRYDGNSPRNPPRSHIWDLLPPKRPLTDARDPMDRFWQAH
jgi:hypothetical protein